MLDRVLSKRAFSFDKRKMKTRHRRSFKGRQAVFRTASLLALPTPGNKAQMQEHLRQMKEEDTAQKHRCGIFLFCRAV